ncbi:hypothetical protein C5167_021152 [Papaver somniferum]|uniref:Xrn1 N-terminal domain-containing protein n=1 Tax=Papaver somniferum TaxID=3469 RepID=A0A4Y7IV14_PAPSO|nr:hypothetical protein C5167_021152 [Papaver somniferum]
MGMTYGSLKTKCEMYFDCVTWSHLSQLRSQSDETENMQVCYYAKYAYDYCFTYGIRELSFCCNREGKRGRAAASRVWGVRKVIFSNANVPGEGKHKIMLYVHRQKTSWFRSEYPSILVWFAEKFLLEEILKSIRLIDFHCLKLKLDVHSKELMEGVEDSVARRVYVSIYGKVDKCKRWI